MARSHRRVWWGQWKWKWHRTEPARLGETRVSAPHSVASHRVLNPDESSRLPSTLLPDVWALSPSRPSPCPPLVIYAYPAPGLPLLCISVAFACAKLENWAEHHYPSFVCVPPPHRNHPQVSLSTPPMCVHVSRLHMPRQTSVLPRKSFSMITGRDGFDEGLRVVSERERGYLGTTPKR